MNALREDSTRAEASCGRLSVVWDIFPVEENSIRKHWILARDGFPRVQLLWGPRRKRPLVTIWIGPDYGKHDHRLAIDAHKTGPLPEHGVVWDCTWHTWDHNGTGGENSSEKDLATAIEQSLYRCLVQGFIPNLTSAESLGVLKAAHLFSAAWRKEQKLRGTRWSYA